MQLPNSTAPTKPPNEKTLLLKLGVALVLFVIVLGRLITALIPDASAAAYNLGVEAYARKDFPGAETAFHTATEKNPLFAAAWMNLALTQLELKRYPDAEASARKTVELVETGKGDGIPHGNDGQAMKAQAHANLGMILMQGGKPKDALPEIHKALEIDPANAKAQTWKLAEEEYKKKQPIPE